MKVSELTGPVLDFWVAKAQGLDCALECWMTMPPKPAGVWILHDGKAKFEDGPYMPSSDWAQGGPIIEANKIVLIYYGSCGYQGPWEAEVAESIHYIDQTPGCATAGHTPLEAAMRAFVESKLGAEVEDIPKR